MNPIINYQKYFKLPVKCYQKADRANSTIEVVTPHKGVVFVEIDKIDKGMFKTATNIQQETNNVISEILMLEKEAKDFLLNKWLSESN